MSESKTPETADWPFHDDMPPGREVRQLERANTAPFLKLIGARVEAVRKDWARMAIDYRPDLNQPAGIMHGGVHATLVDTAVAQAIVTTIKPGFQMVTIHLDTKYFKPTASGTLIAEGTIIRKGKRVVHGEVSVTNQKGELVAQGWCVYAIVKARPEETAGVAK